MWVCFLYILQFRVAGDKGVNNPSTDVKGVYHMKIDFQLFAIPAELEGIDEEVLELLKDELPQEETVEEQPQPEEAPEETPVEEAQEVEQEQEAPAEADSDNKQVADNVPGNIPYARFKQQNDKLKSVERELAELKARLETAQQVPPQPVYQQQAPVPQPTPANNNNLDEREVMSAVTQEAIRRAKEKLGLTDDDVNNLDFSDNIEARYQFQTLVQRESNAILDQARRNSQERIAREQQVQQATTAFTNFVNQFQAQADAAERWQYISEERFLQLDQFEQGAIKTAFKKLQQNKGTPGDYFLAVNYFNRASKEFDDKKKPVAPPPPAPTPAPAPVQRVTAADKLKQAQALPKAPNVQGAMSTTTMSLEDIAELMNKPGNEGIDKIPPAIWDRILNGEGIS